MARTRNQMRLVQVLGGLALALVVLGTTIGNVQAQSICAHCQSYYWEWARTGPCKGKSGQQMFQCLNQETYAKCESLEKCPNANSTPSLVTCAGFLELGTVCQNEATGICSLESWALNCEAATSKICRDTQVVAEPGDSTACMVTCTCRE